MPSAMYTCSHPLDMYSTHRSEKKKKIRKKQSIIILWAYLYRSCFWLIKGHFCRFIMEMCVYTPVRIPILCTSIDTNFPKSHAKKQYGKNILIIISYYRHSAGIQFEW